MLQQIQIMNQQNLMRTSICVRFATLKRWPFIFQISTANFTELLTTLLSDAHTLLPVRVGENPNQGWACINRWDMWAKAHYNRDIHGNPVTTLSCIDVETGTELSKIVGVGEDVDELWSGQDAQNAAIADNDTLGRGGCGAPEGAGRARRPRSHH